jgi:O-antigen/teichoic acid export membrane protein
MENVLIQAGIIAILYLIVKFGEMRLILKENKPVKHLLRDSIIVYISSFAGLYIIDQFMLQGETGKVIPKAFTDNPSF